MVRGPDTDADTPVMLDQPESAEWFLRMGAEVAPSWQNQVTVRGGFGGEPTWDPGLAVSHLANTPLLMVVATGDRLASADVAVATYDRATEPKRLVMVEGHHFTPYDGAGFDIASAAAADWFSEHLLGCR